MSILAVLFLASTSFAQDVPLYPRDGKQNQDWGGLNQNTSDLASRNRDKATTASTPQFCPTGQALTGAYFNKSGATVGGACTPIPGAISTTTAFNVNMVFNASTTFNGPVAISSTNQSGTHTVNDGSILQVSTGAVLVLGGLTGSMTTSGVAVYAKSTSGTSDAAGCIVFVSMSNAGTSTDTLIFASTTTTISMESGSAGVLLEPCTNGTVCKVGISGMFFVQADAAGIGATSTIRFSGTRCRALADGAIDSQTIGTKMNTAAIAANGNFWLRLGVGTIH